MFGKGKILMTLAFIFTLIFSVTVSPNYSRAENMHVPNGASILNMVDVLNLVKKGGNGLQEGTRYQGSGQCRGFANKVYNRLFGLQGISGYTNSNYGAQNFPRGC